MPKLLQLSETSVVRYTCLKVHKFGSSRVSGFTQLTKPNVVENAVLRSKTTTPKCGETLENVARLSTL